MSLTAVSNVGSSLPIVQECDRFASTDSTIRELRDTMDIPRKQSFTIRKSNIGDIVINPKSGTIIEISELEKLKLRGAIVDYKISGKRLTITHF